MKKEGIRLNCDNCPMQSWCERADKDYTCVELIKLYQESINRARKSVSTHKVRLEDLYIVNAGWGTDTRLNIKLGRGLNESFIGIAAREAVIKYGNWIVEGYRGNDVILYKED